MALDRTAVANQWLLRCDGDPALIYRPRRFDDVLGQRHVTAPLQRNLARSELPSTLLFSGPAGVGKTTVARIVAAALECPDARRGNPCGECDSCIRVLSGSSAWDRGVFEINSATEGGIDLVRRIRDELMYSHLGHLVYIWDEAHRITAEASDALLKVLEEPSHATFILVTTDPSGLTATIKSRSLRFAFDLVAPDELEARLRTIAHDQGWTLSQKKISKIAASSGGQPRDAIRELERVASGGRLADGDRVSDLAAQLLGLAIRCDFNALHRVLVDLQGVAEPPRVRQECTDLVFGILSGTTNGGAGWAVEALRGLPEHLLVSIGTELSRATVPRGTDGTAAIRGLVMTISHLCESANAAPQIDGGPERGELSPRADLDSEWLTGRCPHPRPSKMRTPLKNGRRVLLKPCDAADCERCAPELARDFLEALRFAQVNRYVVVNVPRGKFNKSADPRDRLNSLIGSARDKMGSIAWAWYAEEEGESIKVHAAVRVDSAERTSPGLTEDFRRAFGGESLVSIQPVHGSRIDPDFLSRLGEASRESRDEAVRRVSAHLRWNGSAILHTSRRFWFDEAGQPFNSASPKSQAQRFGRALRSKRGEYAVTVPVPSE